MSAHGSTIDVEFAGYLSSAHKELNPGFDYYIQNEGIIDIIPNDYYFGTALTSDKLLLK